MADVLDADAVGIVVNQAIQAGLSFQLNIHGVEEISEAIDIAVECLGGEAASHDKVRINQQPSCFVVSALAGKGDVSIFVSKIRS